MAQADKNPIAARIAVNLNSDNRLTPLLYFPCFETSHTRCSVQGTLQIINQHGALGQFGYFGLFGIIFLESMGLPLPGETTLILASGLTATGTFHTISIWIVAASAAILGDNVAYLIGVKGGRPLVLRRGKRFGITHERLETAEREMDRRGWIIVFFARFFPLMRQLNGIAAGTTRMHWRTFLIANAAGAIAWGGMWTFLGSWISAHFQIIPWVMHHTGLIAVIALPLIAALLIGGVWYGRPARSAP